MLVKLKMSDDSWRKSIISKVYKNFKSDFLLFNTNFLSSNLDQNQTIKLEPAKTPFWFYPQFFQTLTWSYFTMNWWKFCK